MKSSNGVGVWRPLMGVVIVGGLALGVSALAAPRGNDPASRGGKDKVGTEVSRLVTGDPTQINQVVAAQTGTAVLEIIPGPARGASTPYPPGVTISGNTMSADVGGFRAFFDWQVGHWDPTGQNSGDLNVCAVNATCGGVVQITLDAVMGFPGLLANPTKPGADLAYAQQACANNAACVTAFGDSWVKCVGGICETSFVDKTGAHLPAGSSYCFDGGTGPCNNGTCNLGANNACFALPETHVADDGSMRYFATTVIDIPTDAKGRYVVNLDANNSFIASATAPPVNMEVLAYRGFVVEIRTGQCCISTGTPAESCQQDITLAQCLAIPEGSFAAGKTCQDRCACTNDTQCQESPIDDKCTLDTCNLTTGICSHAFVSGFDPTKPGGTKCCDSATGNLTTKDDLDACTCDSCTLANNRGIAQHPTCITACNDGNPCTTADTCDGIHTQQNGGCSGTDINTFTCGTITDCPAGAQSCTDSGCVCTLTPKVTFVLNSTPKTCVGGFNAGLSCAKDTDCPGSRCDLFAAGSNCYDGGAKVTATVHIGAAASPINGGQFLINYDPTCLQLNSVNCLAVPPTAAFTAYGPVINQSTGSIFIACGVDPFAKVDGPLGNVDIISLSFNKIGECNECELSMGGFGPGFNPQNTYLVDNAGQAINIESQPKALNSFGELVLNVPDSIKVNSDCDVPTANVTWAAPTATFSCPEGATLTCRGAHESGLPYTQAEVYGGGVLPQGFSSFCCFAAANDKCDQTAGCQGRVNDCPGGLIPDGCWTVEVSDQVSMDIHIQLEPLITPHAEGMTRCIEFCLYGACTDQPSCFTENVLFDGLYNYVGKAGGTIKVPKGKWGCITAQDQLHTLRSGDIPTCDEGHLIARFKGDPAYGGNWLIGGNLDGWKKDNAKASLDTIDILDFGQFVSQFQVCYTGPTPDCHDGPNADINGDGCVTQADYNFILRNFLVSSKGVCCGPQAGASEAPALVEVSVDELNQMGLGDLAVADLNGDGVVNAQDMDAFTQGARPAKSNDRKGVKGLRSGR